MGGIFCHFSDATIIGCVIEGNTVEARDAAGGGIYCFQSSPLIDASVVRANTATRTGSSGPREGGGGIYCTTNSNPTIRGCTIAGNATEGDQFGGGIACTDNSNATIDRCRITGNRARLSGGIGSSGGSNLSIRDCTIAGNRAIQDAIDAATDGDVIVLADNVYTGNRNKNLGFGGKRITVRSENGPDNCIIDCEGFGRGFHFRDGETEAAVVQGLTIRNAFVPGDDGGAILCESSSPTIVDCVLRDNTLDDDHRGSGIACHTNSNPQIRGCTLEQNTRTAIFCNESAPTIIACLIRANEDGGIYCEKSSPTITACTITEKQAHAGAGIGCARQSNPRIEDCTITKNRVTGVHGGGLACWDRSSPIVNNCLIAENVIDATTGHNPGGGGVYCEDRCNPTLTNCVIRDNRFEGPRGLGIMSSSGSRGGGIRMGKDCNATLVDCVIRDNHGDGILIEDGGTPSVVNCLVVGNLWRGIVAGGEDFGATIRNCTISENQGVGLMLWQDRLPRQEPPLVENCTIVANLGDAEGGGIFLLRADATIRNCIIRDNAGDSLFTDLAFPVVTYSDIEGGYAGEGNFDADPRFVGWRLPREVFVDAANAGDQGADGSTAHPYATIGDAIGAGRFSYRLADESPCIGTGAGGTSVGADHGTGGVAGPGMVTLNVASGVYALAGTRFSHHVALRGAGVEETTLRGTVSGLRTGAFLRAVTVTDGAPAGIRIVGIEEAPLIEGCTIEGNTALLGGGVWAARSMMTFTDCTITRNIAGLVNIDGVKGGGLALRGPETVLVRCFVAGNQARHGGGLSAEGTTILSDCTIAWNIGYVSGAGISVGGDTTLDRCTLVGNAASGEGGGIWVGSNSTLTVTNSIVWNNAGRAILAHSSSTMDVRYSDIEGGLAGEGNFNGNPQFVTPGQWDDAGTPDDADDDEWIRGDYALQIGSPGIDAGDNTAVPSGVRTDLGGNPRRIDDPCMSDTGEGTAPLVDLGAYEFVPGGNADCDGDIDLADFLAFVACFDGAGREPAGECDRFDHDTDADVDLADLIFFQARFTGAR